MRSICGKRKPYKNIVIPKGTIDNNRTNVIEIPANTDSDRDLIVKAATDRQGSLYVEPYAGSVHDAMAAVDGTTHNAMAQTGQYWRNDNVGFVNTAAQAQPQPQTQPQSQPLRHNNSVLFTNVLPQFQPQPLASSTQQMNCAQQSQQPTQTTTCCQATQKGKSCCNEYVQPSILQQNYCPGAHKSVSEAHSPLCPICAQALRCGSFPTSRPCNTPSRISQCPLGPSPLYGCGINYSRTTTPCYTCELASLRSQCPLIVTRSETCVSPKTPAAQSNDINRIIDEKIEKILKPLLTSLVKMPETTQKNNDQQQQTKCYICQSNLRDSSKAATSSFGNCAVEAIYQNCLSAAQKREAECCSKPSQERYSQRVCKMKTSDSDVLLSDDSDDSLDRKRRVKVKSSRRESKMSSYDGRMSKNTKTNCPAAVHCARRANVKFKSNKDDSDSSSENSVDLRRYSRKTSSKLSL